MCSVLPILTYTTTFAPPASLHTPGSFIEILEDNPDYLPAVLGMATGFMIEKNSHKARNLLKRVSE